jgi:hypothetical protein
VAALLIVLGLLVFRGPEGDWEESVGRDRAYANTLKNNELYRQAIGEYERILSRYPVDPEQEANLSYMIATVYLENLRDAENALAWFLRVKERSSNKDLLTDVDRRVVECLEKMDRSLDAENALRRATEPPGRDAGDRSVAVARIGEREITLIELEREIQRLPPSEQKKLAAGKEKLEFLKGYIAKELMYNAAKRSGFEDDPEIREAAAQAEKHLMIQKFYGEEILKGLRITESDVKTFYEAHKAEYAEPGEDGKEGEARPFEAVRTAVYRDLARLKEEELANALIARMMEAEKVVVFEEALFEEPE